MRNANDLHKMPEPNFDKQATQMFLEHLKSIKTKPNRKVQRFKFFTNPPNQNN